ncbi:MAG TPA: hypothetical protein PKJ37_12125 [Acidobacteriota bacterium]|nr:hypothetical protein [Acidobacteriota bacterium]HNT18625.1 hypothetical protein [Acidobacteriota bacterium]
MDELDEAIRQIVDSISAGLVFDNHTVIQKLIEEYSDTYLSSFSGGTTEGYHGLIIAQKIRDLGESFVILRRKAYSKNIHGKYTECDCWVKK